MGDLIVRLLVNVEARSYRERRAPRIWTATGLGRRMRNRNHTLHSGGLPPGGRAKTLINCHTSDYGRFWHICDAMLQKIVSCLQRNELARATLLQIHNLCIWASPRHFICCDTHLFSRHDRGRELRRGGTLDRRLSEHRLERAPGRSSRRRVVCGRLGHARGPARDRPRADQVALGIRG